MKRLAAVFVVILASICFAGIEYAPQPAEESKPLTEFQIRNLATFCKVWGFLKYYHPYPSKKHVNWDQVLIENYPKVKSAITKEEFNAVIRSITQKTGSVKTIKHPFTAPDSLSINVDFSWINDTASLDKSNSLYLNSVRVNHTGFNNKYVSPMLFTRNPKFNEDTCEPNSYTIEAYRFLALARYWNVIEYFFPSKYLMDTNWDSTLIESVPKFVYAKTQFDYLHAIQWTTARIDDGHGFVRAPWFPLTKYVPITTFYNKDTLYVTGHANDSFAATTKIIRGDKIVSINGQSVKDRWMRLRSHRSASNESYAEFRFASSSDLTSTELDSITFVLIRDGNSITVTEKTYRSREMFRKWKTPQHKLQGRSEIRTDSISGKRYGYFNMGTLKKSQVDSLFKELKGVDHLILEVRNYPSDFPAWIKVANKIVYPRQGIARMSYPDYDHPGYLKFTQVGLKVGTNKKDYYKGKIYILIHHYTMSAAEYETMGLRLAPNSVVIGTQTAGADGNVSTIVLPGNYSSTFSGLGWYYADGRQTQRIGIVPDIKVEYTVESELAQRDPIMEKALELIRTSK